jgi:hypothetical protein
MSGAETRVLIPTPPIAAIIGRLRPILALAGILCAYLAVIFECEEVLSNIVCHRAKKTRVSVGLFSFIERVRALSLHHFAPFPMGYLPTP